MSRKLVYHLAFFAVAWSARTSAAEPLVQLQKGDHIAIVGSGLADRQQHQGWFETLIQKSFAGEELTIRNLGFAADEINVHPRSADVPPIEWFLAMKKGDSSPAGHPEIIYKAGTDFGADVIFAYWGFNESFRGPQGLEKFKAELTKYLAKLRASNFSGEGAPRVVLFSPIAQEDVDDPNFPDSEENNRNIGLYTHAMSEVAKTAGVPFVDLFTPSTELYRASQQPLTINGIHLTDDGDKLLAPIQFEAVFGKKPVPLEDPSVAKIRDAVLEKNYEWSHRYRTVDQYNIFGERSRIAYEGTTNAHILGQELAQRDVKTVNRDKLVWAVAQGNNNYQVKDDNLPPVDLTPPNRKDEVPYMDPEEAIKYLKLAPGCKVELVASEKAFPDLINPVQMAFDPKGRLWLAVWPNYPETSPTTKDFDKILIVDLDPVTGKAAKITTFMDGLNCPTGFQFYKDGILLMQSPDLLWVRDTDGDGKADKTERVLHGMDAADSHHETNSMCYEPGGAVYLSDGIFLRSNVETTNGPIRNVDGGIYRYEPLTGKFMRHAPYGLLNPHGRVFDYWGNDFITDATGNANYYGPAMSGHLDTGAHPRMKEFWERPSRPSPGTALLTSRHFPDDWQGLFLNTNVISVQGIFRAKLTEEGSGIRGETISNLIETDIAKNPNFRPSGITVAPDGSLYFMDWSQMLIGHLQHHLRDPNRDHQHGRLYRITYPSRPLLVPKKIDGQPIPELLALLKEPENDVRLRAKIELGKRDPKQVTDAVVTWVKTLDPKEATHEHDILEALWVHQWHNVVNLPLLERVMKSPDPRARAQGVRVLGYWRDRVPGAIAKVKAAADDEAPRVRLEAVRVASFFRETAAADAALTALKHPMDYYLDYCFKETMRQLKPWWTDAVAEGKEIASGNPAGLAYLLDSVASSELLKLPKTPVTCAAILLRPDVTLDQRSAALNELARLKGASPTATLLDTLAGVAGKSDVSTQELCALLLQQPAASLKSAQDSLEKLAAGDASPTVRRSVDAALISIGSRGATASEVAKKPETLLRFLDALPLVPDAAVRKSQFPFVRDLLVSLPSALDRSQLDQPGIPARVVRISLPRRGTLSLAEVQVFSGGKNIAATGTAKQSGTAYNGGAELAIDGNTDGIYDRRSVTHTEENVRNPWWQLELPANQPIEGVVVWNRTDGTFANRMDGFSVVLTDSQGREVFRKAEIPAPAASVRIELKGDQIGNLRRKAILALPSLDVSSAAFEFLTAMILRGDEVPTAVKAVTALPQPAWKDHAGPVVGAIVKWARTVPSDRRTMSDYTETVGVARKLISQLPADQSAAAQDALSSLDVRSITIQAVREQLRFDKVRLVVEAGKPFEVIFENPDAMPHNLVFVMPGTLQDVATAVQAQAPDKLDHKGRAYVPDKDPRVLDATKLVEAGKSETLQMIAPQKEGVYQYVCTFPGHWAVMKGDLIVTKDVKAYLAANPEK